MARDKKLLDPAAVEAALSAYYDDEGDERTHSPLDPRRVAGRDAFVERLSTAGRPTSVLEVGSGPGRDAGAFISAGHRYVAVDLSFEHARRCHHTGAAVAMASVREMPFRSESFDALWSMSTLMHVPEGAIEGALTELARVLKPGGVATIGVWGGPDIEDHSENDRHPGRPPRLFSRRSNERWRSMLATVGTVEEFEAWSGGDDFFYQWATIRR